MKTFCIVAALFTLVSCVKGVKAPGWEELISHKDSDRELRAAPVITIQKSVQNDKLATMVLLVENQTGIDIDFFGYSKFRPQLFFKKKRGGNWEATAWDWCGTGMEKHVLKNQRATTFEIGITKGPVQVFTIFRNANDPKEFSLVKLYESKRG